MRHFAPALDPGTERANPVDGATLVWVPSTAEACRDGTFRMGSTPEEIEHLWREAGWGDWLDLALAEQPAHEVDLAGFWLYKHPVTVDRYAAFLTATGYGPPAEGLWEALASHGDLPMPFLSWADAAAYSDWAGAALPTEAQWEYAARGPDRRAFPWGDEWAPSRCNCPEHLAGRILTRAEASAWRAAVPETAEAWVASLRPAGSLPQGASWCGALGMAGNLWEWCRDWFDPGFYGTLEGQGRNPECRVARSQDRVLRGGSWQFGGAYCRGSHRGYYNPLERLDFGVRPAATDAR